MLQKNSNGVEENMVFDTDYAGDMAILGNFRDGLQESTDMLAHYWAMLVWE